VRERNKGEKSRREMTKINKEEKLRRIMKERNEGVKCS
jgi:hypothetical protein